MKIRFLFLLLLCLVGSRVIAQPVKEMVQVMVTPDRSDWTYQKGDRPEFTVRVLKNNVSLDGVTVNYEYGPELMKAEKSGSESLKKGALEIKTGTMKDPGFLRLTAWVEVDGKRYSSYATAGFSPEKIEPTTTLPADFSEFWENAKNELKKVPVKPVLTLLPERCTETVDVYHVQLDNISGKIYGILCKPKKAGTYPALLQVPGAGVRPYSGDLDNASRGVITFQIGIHGIPVNLPQVVYDDLRAAALQSYWTIGLDDRDNYYYKRVYLGCVRAIDFIAGLDYFDGQNLAVTGGSQGGALSIITAALDSRVKYLAAFYPALSDLPGYLSGRAGGWPHLFKNGYTNKPEKVAVSKYYDVVNFARFVGVPGWYSWGYNDNVCPPTSMFAAYNVIKAPKELHVFQETQHWTFPEQRTLSQQWLLEKLLQ